MLTGAIVILLLLWAVYWAIHTKLTFSKMFKNVRFYISFAAAVLLPLGFSFAAALLFEIPEISAALFGIGIFAVAGGLIWHTINNAKKNYLYALQKHNIFAIGFVLSVLLPVVYLLTPTFFHTVTLSIEALKELPDIFKSASNTLDLLKEAFENQPVLSALATLVTEQGTTADTFIAASKDLFGNNTFEQLNTIYTGAYNTTFLEAFKEAGNNWAALQSEAYSTVVRTTVATAVATAAPLGMFFAGLLSAVLPGSLFASVGRILHPNDDSDWPAKIVLTNIVYVFIMRFAWALSPYVIGTTIDNFNAVFGPYFKVNFHTTLELPTSFDKWTFYSDGSALSFVLIAYLLIGIGAALLYMRSHKRNTGFFIGSAASSALLPVLLLIGKDAFLPFNLLGLAVVAFPGIFLYLFGYIYHNVEMKSWEKSFRTLCISSTVYLLVLILLYLFFH